MTNENDWVTQDVVPRRPDVDEFRWIKKDGTATSWLLTPEDYNGLISGVIVLESRLEVRCKRKDHPVLGKVDIKPLPCPYCTLTTFKGWQDGKCPYCGRVRGVCSGMVSQDELNAEPRTRAWTFGKPAQTGHFLICYGDPAIVPQDIHAVTLEGPVSYSLWFIYLGQTSDFADPVVPKAKYTLMMDPNEPSAHWYREPHRVQDKLDQGWVIVKEQEFEVPEWDR
jgi:hypothetical protein